MPARNLIPLAQRLWSWTALVIAALSLLAIEAKAVGTWTAIANGAPGGVNTMLLLSDGTVMAQNGGSTTWYKLAPDSTGSYANGTWSTRASMNYQRLYYASTVLQDGRVFFAGGEYGLGTTNAEIYNPVSDSWSILSVPAGLINTNNTVNADNSNTQGFSDSGSVLLANGSVLILPVHPANCARTVIWSPFSGFSLGPLIFRGCNEDEAGLVKLPDDSILQVDNGTQSSSRYIPSSNTFINDASVPVSLFDPFGDELGPAFLLPNGKAIFFGSVSNTAIYTPSGSTSPGSWVAGPNYPNGQAMPDAPGCMMVNGIILLATTPVPSSGTHFPAPVSYYEYDYSIGPVGTFTRVNAPGGGLTVGGASYPHRMLALPNGQVLYTTVGSQLYVYTPSGSPLVAGKPSIYSISQNSDGSYHLTGTLFNGLSQGATYGDDAQMDSNYPLVRLTDGSGNVSYARTYNWSRTSVQTGSATVSTEFSVFGIFPGNYSLQVVANGNPSSAIGFYGPVWVDFNYSGFPFQFGTFYFPYNTLGGGIGAVAPGGTIDIKSSNSTETFTKITKAMELRAIGGPVRIGIGH